MQSEPESNSGRLPRLIATLGFAGYVPVAPGTAGGVLAALVYWLAGASMGPVAWVVVLLLVFVLSVYSAGVAEKTWGKDPSRVVVDEGMGYLVTVAFLPHNLWIVLGGLFIFRVLDISKPPPVRQAERLPGGWGIVLDDVVAGIYGNICLRLVLALWGGQQ